MISLITDVNALIIDMNALITDVNEFITDNDRQFMIWVHLLLM
jgi:hypothetical protein